MKLLMNLKQKQQAKAEEKKKYKLKLSAQDLIPLKAVDSDVFVSDDFRVIKVVKVSSFNLELMSNLELNETLEKYESFLRTLHFPLQTEIISQPVDLKKYVEEQKELLRATTNLYKRELLEGYIEYLHSIEISQSMIQRQRYVVFDEKIMGVTKQAYIDALHSIGNKFKHIKSGLEEIGLEVNEVNEVEIARYFQTMYDYVSSQYRPIQSVVELMTSSFTKETVSKFKKKPCELEEYLGNCTDIKDKISPSFIEEQRDYIQFGDNFVRTFCVIDYPNQAQGNWLGKLYRFGGNINISTHLQPIGSDKMKSHLDKSIGELEARLEEPLKPSRRKDVQKKLESAEKLLETLMDGKNKTIFMVHTYIQLQARSLEELNRLTEQLQGIVWKTGITAYIPRDNMLEGFRSVLPMVKPKLEEYTYQNMQASAVSSLIPFDESELFEQRGMVFGHNMHTDNLVLLDPYDGDKYSSRNMCVFGATGSGKSFFLIKQLLRNFYLGKKKKRIYVIDPEREITEVVEKIGGQVIRMSNATKHIINLFDISDSVAESGGNGVLFTKIQRLKIAFSMIKNDMTVLELALLERAIFETYKTKNITSETDFSKIGVYDVPILQDFFDVIDAPTYAKLADFREILRMYVEGSNSRLFNGYTNVDLDNEIIVFDIKDLEKGGDAQAVCMFNILSFLWDQITMDKEVEKELIVDEAHLLMRNPASALFLLDVYKRIRKYQGSAVVATQQPSDFFIVLDGVNFGKAIINNSMFMLVLGLQGNDIKDLKEYDILRLSEEEEQIILKKKQGEGIFIAGNQRVYMKVDFTPAEMKLINPKQYEKLYGKKVGATA
ncbi:DUF87 domain-containing protein [Bacillus paranthracis]|uniref:VirB4 family type IV secretion system protein n=1 Tax=Bacillus paranthracis TaxID=2026186 RepID=UPI002150EF29|nr:DUF87 domain-containing protein [Bacillus paranthracis]MCR6465155.1 DUF87 domain-containing protein [Bacillus paranthracis]MCR9021605.1 DUF87 domain-containing protein [Bacillus paranthracis]